MIFVSSSGRWVVGGTVSVFEEGGEGLVNETSRNTSQ